MGVYTVMDFSESLRMAGIRYKNVFRVVKAWGYSPNSWNSWKGGFVFELTDGQYAYLSGWCDTTGWGCQAEAKVVFADSVDGLNLPHHLPDECKWDKRPPDLNRWVSRGCPDPDDL